MRPADPQAQRRDGTRVAAGGRQRRGRRAGSATPGRPGRRSARRAARPRSEQADRRRSCLEPVGEPALRSRGQRRRPARRRRPGRARPAAQDAEVVRLGEHGQVEPCQRARRRAPSCRQPGQRRGGAQVRAPGRRRPRHGRGRPARSASVQASRSTRSAPRAPTAARSPARRARARSVGAGQPVLRGPRSTEPGTWALHVHAVPAQRAAARARAPRAPGRDDRRRRSRRRRPSMQLGPVGWCTGDHAGRSGRAAGRTAATDVAQPGQRACSGSARRSVAKPHGHGFAASTSWNRAGNSTDTARAVQHDAAGLQRLAQRVEHAARRTPGASSRNSTPRWARLTAPGRASPLPPPTIAAVDAVWCGARSGGRVTSADPPGSTPGDRVDRGDLERLLAGSAPGRRPGSRSASMVLPAPGGPCRSRW